MAAGVTGVRVVEPPAVTSRFRDPCIEMAHGAGGKASRRLVEGLIAPLLMGEPREPLGDAAILEVGGARLALTSDSFVVTPLTFPGGSIGDLAVNGTVNDLAVSGARPVGLLVTFVLEAGLPTEVLEAEVRAIGAAARRAGVRILGGDTKVVEHGKADRMYVTTTGIGTVRPGVALAASQVRPGDRVLLSGPIGDHGITILLARGDLDLEADLRSDTRPVTPLVEALLDAAGAGVRWMRDPTRGGVATTLNEIAQQSRVGIQLDEEAIPVADDVAGACELLGLDPLYIANEGKVLALLPQAEAEGTLEVMRRHPLGRKSCQIGSVVEEEPGRVFLRTRIGGLRLIDMLRGEPLPRIC
jgi:hydrogenase expression/formation protein HypE